MKKVKTYYKYYGKYYEIFTLFCVSNNKKFILLKGGKIKFLKGVI